MQRSLTLALPLAAAISLVGCGGGSSSQNDDELDTGGLPTTQQEFTSSATWVVTPTAGNSTCFDFDANNDVNCDGTAWDMKISLGSGSRDTAKFYTNSGPKAAGKGGALGDTFNFSWEELQAMKDTSTAPDGNPLLGPMFVSDNMSNGFTDTGAYGAFEYSSQKILSKYSVFLVTTDHSEAYSANSDNIYAVQLVNYYGGDTGSKSGYPEVRYVKLSELGTEGAVKTEQVDASTSWAYLDLTTGSTTTQNGSWHLGFSRYNIITNSGDSGSGKTGTFEAQKAAALYADDGSVIKDKLTDSSFIDEAKKLLTNSADWATPAAASNWKKDTLKSALNPDYKGKVMAGLDYGFYFYTGLNEAHPAGKHAFIANPDNGVLLRSGDGKSYARVHLTNIDAGQYTFEFDVAPAP